MKLYNRIFSVFLSIMIFFLSFFQMNIIVYASDSSHGGSGCSHPEKDKILGKYDNIADFLLQEADKLIGYGVSQVKALYTGDFATIMQNDALFEEYFNPNHVTYSNDIDGSGTPGIVFDEDLTAYLKQALTEYAQEANGFLIYPTTNYLSVPPSNFLNSYAYRTFCALVKENGCIVVNTNKIDSDTLYVARPFDDITKDSISLVVKSNYSNYLIVGAGFYGTNTWELYSTQSKIFRTVSYDTDYVAHYQEFHHWDEGTDFSEGVYSMPYTGLLDMRGKYPLGSVRGWTFFSDDGRRLRVFKSLNDLKNYTTGNRSVYFGSGFYDTPTEIKVSLDDLEKYKNTDYDKLLDELKDLIGKETDNEDSLTEEDLEKLVDKLLEGMNNSGGDNSGDNDNTGGNKPGGDNDNTGGIINGISGYLDTILEYLDGILLELGYISNQIEDMTVEAVEEKTDSILLELFSAFGEIGDLLKTKFPFSIPWDIYSMLSFLSSDDPYDMPARAAPMSYFGDDGVISYSSDDGLVIDYNNIAIHNEGTAMLIDDDGSHGGGGASRPGSDGHYDSEGNYHRAPFYEIPFQISKSMGIEGTLIIDLDPFIPLSEISRTMFTCIFIMSLVNLSTKIVDAMGDLFPS